MNKNLISVLIILILLMISFFCGGKYYINRIPVPQTSSDTILIHDTVPHYIPDTVGFYYYDIDTLYLPGDSIPYPQDIDTLAILANFYNTFKYTRTWKDTIIDITLVDYISENKIKDSDWLQYKLLQPQTIITNVTNITNVNKYLYLNLQTDMGFEFTNVNLNYIGPKMNYGIGYIPKQKALMFNVGFNLIKW